MNLVNILLFGFLGVLFDRAGVGVFTQTADFLMILATVVAIGVVSATQARN